MSASASHEQPQQTKEKEVAQSELVDHEHEERQKEDHKQPAGGYDGTSLPDVPPGWTIKITFHKATNLPMADINTLSSDPYVMAQLNCDIPRRHKEDPELRMRTPTIRRNTDPVWECDWIVANVPSSGFKLKARVYDEDPADHDDRLGNAHINVDHLDDKWEGIKNQPYKIMKRSGSKRAYLIRGIATALNKAKHLNGDLYVSIECLGRTKDESGGRVYTLGPCWWTRHYSPLLGRIANRKESDDDGEAQPNSEKKKTQRYNFQANQMQLQGPVPAQLYHRYVEFRPFVKNMFTDKGVQGWLLSKTLHHQHARVYNFDASTLWGNFPGPSKDLTRQFLDLVHYDQGGRIFTYVLTLDALWRFTETGKEFGIDMLSKHTMHSDVSIYIAFSGEFFIRRLKHPYKPPPPDPAEETSQAHPSSGGDADANSSQQHQPASSADDPPPRDPAHFELVIDNDSGTYRPNAKLLPQLRQFLAHSLPGLHVQVLDCQADSEKMDKWKTEQRDRKKQEGHGGVYTQGEHGKGGGDRASSISSSDESDLDDVEARQQGGDGGSSSGGGIFGAGKGLVKDLGIRQKAHLQNLGGHSARGEREVGETGEQGAKQGE